MIQPVVLAGGRCDDALRALTGVEWRAEIEIDGLSLAERVLEAVRAFGEPLMVGGPELGVPRVDAGATFIESIRRGLEASHAERLLISTVDLPDLARPGLEAFVFDSPATAAFCYSIVPLELCHARYPGLQRTSLRLREGRFTGGNVALVDRALLLRALPILERAYAHRKSPLKLAGLLGLGTLGRVALGLLAPSTLRIRRLEQAAERVLGLGVRAVVCSDAAIGTDIDSADQLRAYLALKNRGS